MPERWSRMRDPLTREEMEEQYFSDASLPADIIKTAWENDVDVGNGTVLEHLQKQTNLKPATIQVLLKNLTQAKKHNGEAAKERNNQQVEDAGCAGYDINKTFLGD